MIIYLNCIIFDQDHTKLITMVQKLHVFCVPFPGAGHAINTFNVAMTLASPGVVVHVLVMSLKDGQLWLKGTGQDDNPNVHIEVIANSKWEEWKPAEPRDIVTQVSSPEFATAVNDKILEIAKLYPEDRCAGLIFNPMMGRLVAIAKEQHLKLFVLNPTPYYMMRLAGLVESASTDLKTSLTYKGIAGTTSDMYAEVGDAVDIASPLFLQFGRPGMNSSDGMIFSNTNTGLEGEEYLQPHMPNHNKDMPIYMIGPILPPLYEGALDDPKSMQTLHDAASKNDPCIKFLDTCPPKSVAYIALGSHAELTIDQALILIRSLRRHNTPWICLFGKNTEGLISQLGGSSEIKDGVVTPWAPQLQVMLHPATKFVLSHGGFGTMIEGIYAGQPFITSPMNSDQFLDTKVMMHLGICLGTISENKNISVLEMKKIVPIWREDAEHEVINPLFDKVLGEGGEDILEKAREASRRLRLRMIEAKKTQGREALKKLIDDLSAS